MLAEYVILLDCYLPDYAGRTGRKANGQHTPSNPG